MPPEKDPKKDDQGSKPGDDKGGKKDDLTAAILSLAETNKSNAAAIEKLNEGQALLFKNMEKLAERSAEPAMPQKQPSNPEPSFKEATAAELESMSRQELLAYQDRRLEAMLKKHLEPVSKANDETREMTQKAAVQAAIKEAAQAHPDFMQWSQEIQAIAKRVPGITPEDAYQLARSQNPEKAQEIDEKLAGDDAGDEDNQNNKGNGDGGDKKPPYSGSPPSGGEAEFATNLSRDDAASKAWEETMAALPKDLYAAD